MAQHFLSVDHTVYVFGPDEPAALTVRPGDTVTFELQDVGSGQFRSDADLYDPATYDDEHDHPMTGPVEIAGAEPGDILRIDIDNIEIWDWGFILLAPEVGVLRHRIERKTKIVAIRDGMCVFNKRIRFPIHPMVGTIGVAPAKHAIRGVLPGAHGGNLDNIYITSQSTVLLPVFVPGAGLSLADLHAAMGDGECCISGVETGGRVTVTVDLIKEKTIRE
jgi:amidase